MVGTLVGTLGVGVGVANVAQTGTNTITLFNFDILPVSPSCPMKPESPCDVIRSSSLIYGRPHAD